MIRSGVFDADIWDLDTFESRAKSLESIASGYV